MIEHIIEIESQVKSLVLCKWNSLANRAIEVPERQSAKRMSIPIDAGAQLNEAELAVHCLRIREDIEPRAAGGGVAVGADAAGTGDVRMYPRADCGSIHQ